MKLHESRDPTPPNVITTMLEQRLYVKRNELNWLSWAKKIEGITLDVFLSSTSPTSIHFCVLPPSYTELHSYFHSIFILIQINTQTFVQYGSYSQGCLRIR